MALRIISIIFNVAASLFGWTSLAITIAGIALTDWTEQGQINYGLFQDCNLLTEQCYATSEDGHWIRTVRAFIIMMIVFGGFACFANVGSHVKKKVKSARTSAFVLFFIAGICGIIGCAVYTARREEYFPFRSYGSGYILSWIGTWTYFIAGLFQGVAACTAPDYVVH